MKHYILLCVGILMCACGGNAKPNANFKQYSHRPQTGTTRQIAPPLHPEQKDTVISNYVETPCELDIKEECYCCGACENITLWRKTRRTSSHFNYRVCQIRDLITDSVLKATIYNEFALWLNFKDKTYRLCIDLGFTEGSAAQEAMYLTSLYADYNYVLDIVKKAFEGKPIPINCYQPITEKSLFDEYTLFGKSMCEDTKKTLERERKSWVAFIRQRKLVASLLDEPIKSTYIQLTNRLQKHKLVDMKNRLQNKGLYPESKHECFLSRDCSYDDMYAFELKY